MERASIPESERTDFYLYIDEFHNIVTRHLKIFYPKPENTLLNLTIAHQYIGKSLQVQHVVLGNTGFNLLSVGEDA